MSLSLDLQSLAGPRTLSAAGSRAATIKRDQRSLWVDEAVKHSLLSDHIWGLGQAAVDDA
jgi:hypothetical protein